MQDFRNLKVWQKAHELTLSVYSTTRGFPRDELFGVTSQMRRAASSIAANIAEGCGRTTDGGMRQSLSVAMGSATELDYHLLLARDLKLLTDETYTPVCIGDRSREDARSLHHPARPSHHNGSGRAANS